jgi:hypothetical protein
MAATPNFAGESGEGDPAPGTEFDDELSRALTAEIRATPNCGIGATPETEANAAADVAGCAWRAMTTSLAEAKREGAAGVTGSEFALGTDWPAEGKGRDGNVVGATGL